MSRRRIAVPRLAAIDCAETPQKARWEARSEAMSVISSPAVAPRPPRLGSALVVLVVAAQPAARLVTPLGGAVEPLVHTPEAVHSARIGGIGVVDDTILEHECAQARPVARIRGHVGSGHRRDLCDRPLAATQLPLLNGFPCERLACRSLAPVVVFNTSLALLLF